ncbi:hypothetical protein HPB48_014109 [Haemaphysalis longicornis]|uniref:Uncharacterized protein n=1 Tax=Haemaphysalis longicornis TaxID=44386 RepID=A0A9J6FJB1_HAELO|nr:hypothetical protein HPB48_014109 [Haemaphysalis longicornis]
MLEVEMVEGMEITPEEARGPGWNAAIAKKRKPRSELHVPDRVAHAGAGTRVSRRTADPERGNETPRNGITASPITEGTRPNHRSAARRP